MYNYSALSDAGYLRIFGPRAAGGITVTVSLVLAFRRHGDDECWMGLMLKPNLVYIMLTRATLRCHVVVEDLSAGVRLPAMAYFDSKVWSWVWILARCSVLGSVSPLA